MGFLSDNNGDSYNLCHCEYFTLPTPSSSPSHPFLLRYTHRRIPLFPDPRMRVKPPTNPLSSLVQLRDRRPRVLARARVHRLLRLPRQARRVLLRAVGRRARALDRGGAVCEEGADSVH